MTFKNLIPNRIDAKEIIDFSKDDSIILLKDSFERHYGYIPKLLKEKLYFPAFVSIMSAIEIYFKIHLTTFCFIHVRKFSRSQKKQIEILTGNDKLLNNFKYSVKSKYSHNLLAMIEDFGYLIDDDPKELRDLRSTIAQTSGVDWASKRYDTESIANESEKILAINDMFSKFTKWMKENDLEVLGKVEVGIHS